MSEQAGSLGKNIQKAITGVAIYYLVAIGITIALMVVAEAFSTIFPTIANPFQLVWNSTRSILLFLLYIPVAVGLLLAAWGIDLITGFLFPFLNGLFTWVSFPVTLVPTDLVTDATALVTQIRDLIEILFPPI